MGKTISKLEDLGRQKSEGRSRKAEVGSRKVEVRSRKNAKRNSRKKMNVVAKNGRADRQPAKNFQDLIVWKLAHKWVLNTYTMTKTFPKDELFGLVSQIRRAAVSVPANIAEGFRRRTPADKARFLNIAQSSLEECRYYLILTTDLEFGRCEDLMNDLEEISRMLEKYYALVCDSAKSQKGHS